jgi:hypothetical protein
VHGVRAGEEPGRAQRAPQRRERRLGVRRDPRPEARLALALAETLEVDPDAIDPGRVGIGGDRGVVGPEREDQKR